jgi:hypothetical protein
MWHNKLRITIMRVHKIKKLLPTAILTFPLLLASTFSWSQGEQVLSEVGAMGKVANGHQGVVIPDFSDEFAEDYTDWVALAAGRNFKSFAISFKGTALVLDGTTIREFTTSGQEETEEGFPVNCTALKYGITKSNGQPGTDSLSTCSAFTPLNDGTIRIAGQSKGRALVVIRYDPETGTTELKASGTPPSISDMDGDEYADSDDRRGAGYWAVGDRKKVIFFPLDDEKNFVVVATINGVTLDGITPFGPDRVIVAATTGDLRAVDTAHGSSSSVTSLPTGAACGLGNKDPQKFSLRGDPTGVLFVGNMGCHEISVFDANLQQIAADDNFSGSPFELNNPSFFVTGLDWQSGQGGDFTDCQGLTESDGCRFGAETPQAVMWNVENFGSDTSYRMFQFVELVDCRWSGDRPCPILNCPSADGKPGGCSVTNKEDQVLDLAQVLIRADQTGVFEDMAFGEGPVPTMAIPGYMRGEECFPSSEDPNVCTPNGYRFHSFFAVTDAIFTGNFFTDYKIDEFRDGSADPCLIPEPQSTIEEVNETANLIVYNSDTSGTVDRGGVEGTRGGVIINDACNGRAGGYKWSAQTIGLELYDDSEEAYIDQADRMMGELIQAREELLCSTFPDDSDLGPLLLGSDCNAIGGELSQMESKLATCFSSLYYPQTGDSAENCNAFFTKVQNLQNVLDAAAWPVPNTTNLELLRPNYEGEFRARLATLVFFIQSYVLNSVPPGGIGAP